MYKLLKLNIILFLCIVSNINSQEVRVIDNKGTITKVRNNQVTTSVTAPTNPLENDVWFDTSTTPNSIKIWDGSTWLNLNKEHVGTTGSVFFANTDGTPTENNSEVFWNNTNNRFGIGTNSPSNKLEVSGAIRSQGILNSNGTINEPSYRFTNDTNTGMFRPAADEIGFVVGGFEAINIDEVTAGNTKVIINQILELQGQLLDLNNSPGTAGQVLSSTATGTDWIDATAINTDTQDLSIDVTGHIISLVDGGSVTITDNVNDADADPTNENQTVSAGTGITVVQAGQDFAITNAAPDQTVAITGTGATTVTGTYPNFSIASTDNVNDADADPLNEIQTITKSGKTITLSNGGGSVDETVTTITNTVTGHKIADYTNENGGTPVAINETVTSLTQDDTPTTTNAAATGEITFKDENGTTTGKAQVVSANADNTISVGTDGGAYLGPTVYTGSFIISANGTQSITGLPFKPSQITFVAHANIESLNIEGDNQVGNNTRGLNNSFGTSNGFARDNSGVTTQQFIYIGGHGNSINDISRYSSSSNCIGIRYGDQNGSDLGKITASLDSFDANGFTIDTTYANGVINSPNGNPVLRVTRTDVLNEQLVVLYTAYK